MSKAPVVVSKIISKQMSVSEAATAYGVSRQHVHRWLVRYRDHGFDGLEPRPRRPHSHPRRTAWEVAERIVATLRARRSRPRSRAADDRLAPRTGASPGAVYLNDPSDPGGSWAGYSRTKEAAQSSYRWFEADQPTECWQSDFTHWQLADGTGVEIINWLDEHSRYLLAAIARPRSTVRTWSPLSRRGRRSRPSSVDPH